MDDIARSCIARDVVVDGKPIQVPPPTVQDAVEIVAAGLRALDEDRSAREVLNETVCRWLPIRLASYLTSRSVDTKKLLRVVLPLLLEGQPTGDADEAPSVSTLQEGLEELASYDMERLLADYGACYGMDPVQVYRTVTWAGFLLFARQTDRLRARRQAEDLAVQSIPKMEDKSDREEMVESIMERAGVSEEEDEMSYEEKVERGKQNLEFLKKHMQGG